MNEQHEAPHRAFSHLYECYYAEHLKPDTPDRVEFGMYYADGSTTGELCLEWLHLGGKPAPRLQAFNDSWRVLASMPDVIAALGERDNQDITPAEFCDLLLTLGFADETKRVRK